MTGGIHGSLKRASARCAAWPAPGRAWQALTFHELIVVVLQRCSLLRHG